MEDYGYSLIEDKNGSNIEIIWPKRYEEPIGSFKIAFRFEKINPIKESLENEIDEVDIKNIFIDYVSENSLGEIEVVSQFTAKHLSKYLFDTKFSFMIKFNGELLTGTHLLVIIPSSTRFPTTMYEFSKKEDFLLKNPKNQELIDEISDWMEELGYSLSYNDVKFGFNHIDGKFEVVFRFTKK